MMAWFTCGIITTRYWRVKMAAICGVLKTAIIIWGIVEIIRMFLLYVMIDNGDANLESGMF